MPNMRYCRFHNTYQDLEDCYEFLNEEGSLAEAKESISESEARDMIKLLKLCKEFVDTFGGELSDED